MVENDKLRRYLVVTDHALDDQQLAAAVQQSLAAGPCQFYLLVLATPAGTKNRIWWDVAVGGFSDGGPGWSTSAPNSGPAAEQGWDRAREQLAHNLVRLRKLGADADGETGEPPALRAIREVLARRPCDEIILATAPHHMTRLLAMDLHHRAQRSFGLPVTVLGIARTDN
jgi:GABA permease